MVQTGRQSDYGEEFTVMTMTVSCAICAGETDAQFVSSPDYQAALQDPSDLKGFVEAYVCDQHLAESNRIVYPFDLVGSDPFSGAAAVEMIADQRCPFCSGFIHPNWQEAHVLYDEDDGDPIYGPPPSHEFYIHAEDWTWLECCRQLSQFLRGVGGKSWPVNKVLGNSPNYSSSAWLRS